MRWYKRQQSTYPIFECHTTSIYHGFLKFSIIKYEDVGHYIVYCNGERINSKVFPFTPQGLRAAKHFVEVFSRRYQL